MDAQGLDDQESPELPIGASVSPATRNDITDCLGSDDDIEDEAGGENDSYSSQVLAFSSSLLKFDDTNDDLVSQSEFVSSNPMFSPSEEVSLSVPDRWRALIMRNRTRESLSALRESLTATRLEAIKWRAAAERTGDVLRAVHVAVKWISDRGEEGTVSDVTSSFGGGNRPPTERLYAEVDSIVESLVRHLLSIAGDLAVYDSTNTELRHLITEMSEYSQGLSASAAPDSVPLIAAGDSFRRFVQRVATSPLAAQSPRREEDVLMASRREEAEEDE